MTVVTVVVMMLITTAIRVAMFLDDDISTVRASVTFDEHRALVNSTTVTVATRDQRARSDQPAHEQVRYKKTTSHGLLLEKTVAAAGAGTPEAGSR